MKRITEIVDSYGLSSVEFCRDDNPTGALYYKPSKSSQKRIRRLLDELRQSGRLKDYRLIDSLAIWHYQVIR